MLSPRLAQALVRAAPNDVAKDLLEYVVQVTGALEGAVLTVSPQGTLGVGPAVATPGLGLVAHAGVLWREHDSLRSGVVYVGTMDGAPFSVTPLMFDGTIRGLVVLAGVAEVDLGPFVPEVLAAALAAPGVTPVGAMTMDERKREMVLTTLERHQWNIAAAARELGVTRRTVYLQLERWNVQRRKVVKSERTLRRLRTNE